MKSLLVIKREYVEHVRKKSFVIGTILAPVIMLLLYSIPILSIFFVPGEQLDIAVLDRAGGMGDEFVASVRDTLDDGRPKYILTNVDVSSGELNALREDLIQRVTDDELDVIIELPEDVLQKGRVNYIAKNVLNEQVMDYLKSRLNPVIISKRFAAEGVSSDRIAVLTRGISFNEQKITRSGIIEEEAVAGEFIVAVVFVFILYILLISWGISVQRGIIEEKGSRVIEVMLSSVEPRDLFIGKIVGIGAAGFTQIAIWGVLFMTIAFSTSIVAAKVADFVRISPLDVFYLLVFFVLGFLFYAGLFTIIGAMCTTEQDAQQLQSLVMLPLIVPFMLSFLVLQNPASSVAVVLSMIPFFTPMLMLARVSVSDPGFWQVALSIALLIVSIYAVVTFSAKVFRVGILMYGKRPSLKEVWRWSRYT